METIIHNHWTSPHWFGLLPKFLKIHASKNELQDTSWEMIYLPILKTFPRKQWKTQRSTNWFCDLGIDIYNHIHVYNNHIYIYTYKHIYGGFRKHPKSFPCHHPVTHLSTHLGVDGNAGNWRARVSTCASDYEIPSIRDVQQRSSDWMRFDNLDCCSWWYVQTLITSNIYNYK